MFSFLYNSKLISQNTNRCLLLNLFNSNGRRRSLISSNISTTTNDPSTAQFDTNTKSFTLSYLINSCGLSEAKAITLSKTTKLRLKTSFKPDSVLTLLRNYGFDDTHISNLVQRRPALLLADPNKNLKPKIEFFNSIGLSGNQLADILSKNPHILHGSLENRIIPSIAFLKTILHTDTKLIKVFKLGMRIIGKDLQKQLAPKIALLQAHGVSNSNISLLLTNHPRTFVQISVDRFDEVVKQVKEMGFDPSKSTFVFGVCRLSLSKSLLEGKVDVYRRWGWSEEEIREAFLKQPNCMACSKKKINQIMDFLVNKMGYDPSLVAKNPNLLLLSLEKRIIPRCLVFQVLMAKGLVKKDHAISTIFLPPDKCFLKNFVAKFENQVPELLSVYRRKVNAQELLG